MCILDGHLFSMILAGALCHYILSSDRGFFFDIHSFRSIVLKWESLIRKSIWSRLGIGIYICNLNGIEARDCEELFFPVRFGLGKEEEFLL
jgi:hypothetical protein